MNCADVELELSGELPSAEALTHAAGCASCGESARLLSLAGLPPPGPEEGRALTGLPSATLLALGARRARGSGLRRWVGLSLAAGVGALVASGAFLALHQPPRTAPLQTVAVEPVYEPPFDFAVDEAAAPSDELTFDEVAWPTEGEL